MLTSSSIAQKRRGAEDLEAAARTTKPLAAPGSSLTTKELLRSQSRPVLEPDLWGMPLGRRISPGSKAAM